MWTVAELIGIKDVSKKGVSARLICYWIVQSVSENTSVIPDGIFKMHNRKISVQFDLLYSVQKNLARVFR